MITDRIGGHEVRLPIKTMTKFEEEARHRLYVFIEKKQLTRRNDDAFSPNT